MSIPLFRVKYWDAPIPHGGGALLDYVPVDLPYGEAKAIADSADQTFHRAHIQVRPADGPPSRDSLVHAVAAVAEQHGITLPCKTASLTRRELDLAGAYVMAATNTGNRRSRPPITLGMDNQGRLVVKLGGAR
jgi:hypothetical protein